MLIRRAGVAESRRVHELVRAIVDEVYGLPNDDEDWTASWIAVIDGAIVGVAKTFDDRVEDLWVARAHRSRGVGAQLLWHGEREIASRGIAVAHLRVVAANTRARQFYERNGWIFARAYPHERTGREMLEMTKAVGSE